MFVVGTVQLIAVAVNQSVVQCAWKPVADVHRYTVLSCSGRLRDRLCHVCVECLSTSVHSRQLSVFCCVNITANGAVVVRMMSQVS